MNCGNEWIAFKSFTETVVADEEDALGNRMLSTEVQVDVEEFDLFEVREDVGLTFSLKDFKVSISF